MAKILIADDAIHTVTLFKHYLTKMGFEVIEAFNGEEAIKKTQSENPDIILLDILMPDMTGVDVCKQLRSNESTSSIPIVILTTPSEIAGQEISVLKAGVDDFLIKSLDEAFIIAKVRSLLRLKDRKEQLIKLKSEMYLTLKQDIYEPVAKISRISEQLLKEDSEQKQNKEVIENINKISKQLLGIITNKLKSLQ